IPKNEVIQVIVCTHRISSDWEFNIELNNSLAGLEVYLFIKEETCTIRNLYNTSTCRIRINGNFIQNDRVKYFEFQSSIYKRGIVFCISLLLYRTQLKILSNNWLQVLSIHGRIGTKTTQDKNRSSTNNTDSAGII